MISLVFANIYVVMTFIICDFTQDQQMGWLVHIELFFLLLVAQHFAWMQFSIQVYLFQIFTLTFVLVGFFCMLFIVSAGVICYGTISDVPIIQNLKSTFLVTLCSRSSTTSRFARIKSQIAFDSCLSWTKQAVLLLLAV